MILKLIILLSLYIYVQNPKNGDVFFHYSTDEKKLDDLKSDGMNWCITHFTELQASLDNPD